MGPVVRQLDDLSGRVQHYVHVWKCNGGRMQSRGVQRKADGMGHREWTKLMGGVRHGVRRGGRPQVQCKADGGGSQEDKRPG